MAIKVLNKQQLLEYQKALHRDMIRLETNPNTPKEALEANRYIENLPEHKK